MAKQDIKTNEQQNQESHGQDVARSSQQRGVSRGYPMGLAISPADFFRISPFTLMRRMTEEMDRAFGQGGGNSSDEMRGVWAPAIEVRQKDGNYVVHAELPGINADEVKLQITDDAIVLQGERKVERDENRQGVHLTERRYGRFFRSIPLPEGAKVEEAKAQFQNGVLEVTVPVAEQRNQPREIPIQGASTSTAQGSASQTQGPGAGSSTTQNAPQAPGQGSQAQGATGSGNKAA